MAVKSIQDILERLLKKYDAVEVKKVHGRLQFIGINRKAEEQVDT